MHNLESCWEERIISKLISCNKSPGSLGSNIHTHPVSCYQASQRDYCQCYWAGSSSELPLPRKEASDCQAANLDTITLRKQHASKHATRPNMWQNVQLLILFKIPNQSSLAIHNLYCFSIAFLSLQLCSPQTLPLFCWDFCSFLLHVNLVILEIPNGPHSKSKALFGTVLSLYKESMKTIKGVEKNFSVQHL